MLLFVYFKALNVFKFSTDTIVTAEVIEDEREREREMGSHLTPFKLEVLGRELTCCFVVLLLSVLLFISNCKWVPSPWQWLQ
jgi:hypothetical protein